MKMNIIKTSIALAFSGMVASAPVSAVEFGAFGDINWSKSDATGATSAFALGGLDLYARQQIDPNTIGFIEYVFENNGESFVIDLERLYVQRDIGNDMKVAAGRFHSPLGFWNNTYHHGVLIQDTYSRPSFLDFEDGESAILPTHVIGVTLDGKAGDLGYELALANSTFLDTSAGAPEIGIGNVMDFSDDKTLFARATYDVRSVGVNLGFSYMANSIVEGPNPGGYAGINTGDELIAQTVMGLDGRYSYNDLDVLGEYFMMTNDAASGVGDGASHDASAFYLQLSYDVSDKVRPTYRYESLAFDETGSPDEYFAILGREEYSANVIALRYNLDDSNALTFEYRMNDYTNRATDSSESIMTLDWSFLMF